MTTINPERVQEIVSDCLYGIDEEPVDAIAVEGIVARFGFRPSRLEQHKDEIVSMLLELPDSFHEGTGDGMSFLNACVDKHGNQWTGLHSRMEMLFCLGMAIGRVKCLFDRGMWSRLPGGMPYFQVTKEFFRPGDFHPIGEKRK